LNWVKFAIVSFNIPEISPRRIQFNISQTMQKYKSCHPLKFEEST